MLANNKLTKLPFNPHSTSRGLRRLTLQGNQLDISTLQLDTDVREEQKKQGGGGGGGGGGKESGGGGRKESGGETKTRGEMKMDAIGEDDEGTSGDESDDGGF